MQPIVTGRVLDVDHPKGSGRFLSTESLYHPRPTSTEDAEAIQEVLDTRRLFSTEQERSKS